ncbi:amidohydrolase [bacterium]|nr:amidohydrolase [bacterium]
MNIKLLDIDRQIWDEELEDFVPKTIFDAHTHLYKWAHTIKPQQEQKGWQKTFGKSFPNVNWRLLNTVDELLLPGRKVHRLTAGMPFVYCNFEAANYYTASEVSQDPKSGALMLVHPSMSAKQIENAIKKYGFIGFKPYRFYSVTGNPVECRITDFLPEKQIAIANRYGLMIMLHISKRAAISDEENLSDLERLTGLYPNVKWNLCHCARSYYDRPLTKARERLKKIPNLWYDISSVCDADTMDMLLSIAGPDRVMYGSDDIPIGITKGKYITFGFAWTELNEHNHQFNLSHCNPNMTFVRYEMLRAFQRAVRRQGYGKKEIENLFYGNAFNLISLAHKKRMKELNE